MEDTRRDRALKVTGGGAGRAGPVRVEGSPAAPPAGGWDEQDVRLAVLAELALRLLAGDRGRPW